MFEIVSERPVEIYSGDGKTPFAKHLRWKMKTREIEVMDISPEMAAEMLKYNTSNRPCSPGTVKKFADQMERGEWRYIAQPIIFSPTRLQDGQHRLEACVLSGATFTANVAFGEPDENFAFVDVGKPRNAADIFAINGVPNYATASTMTRLVMGYDQGWITSNLSPTPTELYDYYQKLPRLQDSMPIQQSFRTSKLAPPSTMGAMHYICARKNRTQADEFFRQVSDGIGIQSAQSASAKLRKKLIENYGSVSGKLSALVIAAYTIKAWNALRNDRSPGKLQWRGEQSPNEAFPRAI